MSNDNYVTNEEQTQPENEPLDDGGLEATAVVEAAEEILRQAPPTVEPTSEPTPEPVIEPTREDIERWLEALEKYGFTTVENMRPEQVTADWLYEEARVKMFARGNVVTVYGDSGSFKTAWILGVANRVAADHGAVLYYCAEDRSGVTASIRIRKREDRWVPSTDCRRTVHVAGGIDGLSKSNVPEIARLCKEFSVCMVVFDTLDKSLGEVSQNKDNDLNNFLVCCQQLAEQANVAVVILAHKNARGGLQGGPRLRKDSAEVYETKKTKNQMEIIVEKRKHGAAGQRLLLEPEFLWADRKHRGDRNADSCAHLKSSRLLPETGSKTGTSKDEAASKTRRGTPQQRSTTTERTTTRPSTTSYDRVYDYVQTNADVSSFEISRGTGIPKRTVDYAADKLLKHGKFIVTGGAKGSPTDPRRFGVA